VYCNRSCLWHCHSGRAGGVRTLLQPACAQCSRLAERFFHCYYCYCYKQITMVIVVIVSSSDVVLETRVLVSRRLEDSSESLGLGLKKLVSVLKKKSFSFQDICRNSWRQWARHTVTFCERQQTRFAIRKPLFDTNFCDPCKSASVQRVFLGSFPGGKRGNAVPIVTKPPKRTGTAFQLLKKRIRTVKRQRSLCWSQWSSIHSR